MESQYKPFFDLLNKYKGSVIQTLDIPEDFFIEPRETISDVDVIKKAITSVHGLSFEQMNIITRKRECVEARQHFFYQMKAHTKQSDNSIGLIFAKKFDHSTVIHGKSTWKDLIDTDKRKKAMCDAVTSIILNSFMHVKN